MNAKAAQRFFAFLEWISSPSFSHFHDQRTQAWQLARLDVQGDDVVDHVTRTTGMLHRCDAHAAGMEEMLTLTLLSTPPHNAVLNAPSTSGRYCRSSCGWRSTILTHLDSDIVLRDFAEATGCSIRAL
ncbi:hypothetical protein ACHAC9_00745 [Massilia sp. CMS3.1]|uniref:hypothetical protein n=1 Tax=Massilia sp. CMS3.1 TaxID=3373083 RepID=UPI003EE4DD0B